MPLFEKATSLATSRLWKLLSDLYEKEAKGSWQEVGVPFYLTSTPKLARQWAQVCLDFFLEMHEKEPRYGSEQSPWTILEIGSGAGRFAYLFLSFFDSLLREHPKGKNLHWKYLMLDISQPVVDSWQSHPWLKGYWKRGHLMSARFDLNQSEKLILNDGSVLEKGAFEFPCAMLAGYLFDTLPAHAFRTMFGQTFGLGIEVHAPALVEEVGTVSFLKDMSYSFFENEQAIEVVEEYAKAEGYTKAFEELKRLYETSLEDGQAWTLSTGALDCFKWVKSMSPSGFLALTGDQGMGDIALLRDYPRIELGRHGSISCPVNYHGLKFVLESMGHKAVLSNLGSHKFITLAAFVDKAKEAEGSIAKVQRSFDDFDNVNYWSLVNKLFELPQLDLELLEYTLKIGDWDPINFFHMLPKWKLMIEKTREYQKQRWRAILERIESRFFPISAQEAVLLNELGVCFSLLNDWRGAKRVWEKAAVCSQQLGNQELAPVWLNLAIAAMHEGDEEKARTLFLKAEQLCPEMTAHLPLE